MSEIKPPSYRRTSPQIASAEDGSVVQVLDRQTIQYLGRDIDARVDVDIAEVTGLYPASLRVRTADGRKMQLSERQREAVLQSIEAGLASLGIESERCE